MVHQAQGLLSLGLSQWPSGGGQEKSQKPGGKNTMVHGDGPQTDWKQSNRPPVVQGRRAQPGGLEKFWECLNSFATQGVLRGRFHGLDEKGIPSRQTIKIASEIKLARKRQGIATHGTRKVHFSKRFPG